MDTLDDVDADDDVDAELDVDTLKKKVFFVMTQIMECICPVFLRNVEMWNYVLLQGFCVR